MRRRHAPIDHHPSVRQVLEHYGARAMSGPRAGWARALCPFHDDRTPSAAVNDVNNLFYCFACQISTTAVGIIMRKEHMTYGEAKKLADDTFGEHGSSRQEDSSDPLLSRILGAGRRRDPGADRPRAAARREAPRL